MVTLSPEEVTSLTRQRYLYYWAWVVVARIAPIIVLGIKYGFFSKTTSTGYKVSFAVGFALVWVILSLWGNFVDWTRTLRDGFVREFMGAISKLGPYLLFTALVAIATYSLSQLQYIAVVLGSSQVVGTALIASSHRAKNKLLLGRGYVRELK